MIETAAAARPDAPAIMAPDAAVLSCRALADQAAGVRQTLSELGLGAGHRVAVAVPSDAALAVCFLSVSATAACAPLNVAYRADEFGRLLEDLRADALIVDAAFETPARDQAVRRGIPVIALHRRTAAGAGAFELRRQRDSEISPEAPPPGSGEAAPGRDDIALVLHTSGTTARPKIVPLSHGNLTASARNIT